ncbi:MAG: class I SAM-dependent methyltransferase [Rubrivivax sp.]|nr:class I SAM-dependent methyltransferase [Rubrivivax sp.]
MSLRLVSHLPWPAPALLAWTAGWAAAWSCRQVGLLGGPDLAVGTAVAVAFAVGNAGAWRRFIAASGFPASTALLAIGAGADASAWLLALAPLLLLYPLRAWRDAPFFPTPAAALTGLDRVVNPPPRCVLDAGCGLGHGLAALRRLWPGAALHGVEWSLPMAWLAARRLPSADITRGDMWARSWSGFDFVYLFQRPETMPRAWQKALAEMADGAWFASLEFPVPGVASVAVVDAGVGRPLHLYRVRCAATTASGSHSTGARPGR